VTDVTLRIKVDSSEVDKGRKSLDGLAASSDDADKSTDKLTKTTGGLTSAAKAAGAAIVALGGSMVVRQAIEYADAWQNATNQLKTVQGATENLSTTQAVLMRVANDSRASFEATAGLYTRLSRATANLNLDQAELIDLTDTINKSFAVSGASAQEASNAITQLSQGLAAGALRGDEFNSVSEQSPILMQAIADSLRMTRGELRNFAAEGGITAEIVVTALQRASGEIDATFRKMSATFEQNMTVANNNMMEFVGSSEAVKGVVGATGAALVFLSENLETVATVAGIAASMFAAKGVVGLVGAMSATVSGMTIATTAAGALRVALTLLGGPVGIIVGVVSTLAVLGKMMYDNRQETEALEAETAALARTEENHNRILSSYVGSLDDLQGRLVSSRANHQNITAAMGENSAEALNLEREIAELEIAITAMGGSTTTATTAIVAMTAAEEEASLAIMAKVTELDAERAALKLSERELFILNATKIKGIELTDDQKEAIIASASALFDERAELKSSQAAQEALNLARAKAVEHTQKLVTENKRAEIQLVLNERQQAIYNAVMSAGTALTTEQMIAIEASINSLYDQRDATDAATAAAERNQEAVDVWTKLSTRGAEQRAAAEIESQRRQEEAISRTHEYLTTSFIDIFNNGRNAFDNIAKAFSTMIQRMLAEWAASKLMEFIGIGSGGGGGGSAGASVVSAATSAVANAAAKAVTSAITGGSAAAAGTAAAGAAGGAAAGTGIGATIASAAGSVGTAITGGAAAVGSAISGGASAATALIAANPLLAAAALAAAAAAALAKKPTLSSNAGLLIHDAPGASADRKFAVDAFASGFAPVGFARREDQSAANEVIDVFRKYDASLTEIAKAAGLNVNFSNNPFGGFDEKGQGNGLFLGTAAEEKKGVTSAPISEQLTKFTKQWVEALGGQVSPADREFLLSSGSADVLLERAATLGQAERGRLDGIGFGGIRNVPFNGFRAELHKGEEVLTASDPRNRNNGGMMSEMRDMLTEMRNMAFYTKRTADLLLRVTRDGDSLVTVAA
jgi:tape measure domain-containing protein